MKSDKERRDTVAPRARRRRPYAPPAIRREEYFETVSAGSASFATKRVGATISSRRLFGVGKSTSNSSMVASSPQLLKRASSHSELSLP